MKRNAVFILNGFDDQERNLTLVKTDFQIPDFQISKHKFHACNFKQAFNPLHKPISRDLDNTKILLFKLFVRCLVVKLACVTAV